MLSSTAIAVLITLPIMIVILKPRLPGRVILLAKITLFAVSLIALIYFLLSNKFLPLIALVYLFFLWVANQALPTILKRLNQTSNTSPALIKARSVLARYMDHGVIHIDGFAQAYHRLILRILSSRSTMIKVIIGIVAYAVISFLLLPLGLVQNEFFPKTDQNVFFVQLEMPPGTTLQNTEEEGLSVLEKLRQTHVVDFVIAEVGRSQTSNQTQSNDTNLV